MTSFRESTGKQYNSSLNYWWEFCLSKSMDPFNANEKMVLLVLTKKFKEGAGYGTLNTLRSAISQINLVNNSDSQLINQFFKAVYLRRPTTSKYNTSWDVDKVFTEIRSWGCNQSLSLVNLTLKLVMLLAIGSAYRTQSLTLIRISKIHFNSEGAEIRIEGLTKTSRPGSKQPYAFFPFFTQPDLCIARTLQAYLNATQNIRKEKDQLLISFKSPFKKVTTQTIGRWLKTVITMAGIEDSYTAHSTRHAAASTSKRKGLDVGIIKESVGWSNTSQVFAKFYDRPLKKFKDNFAQAVFS